jgi:hypothetical protein
MVAVSNRPVNDHHRVCRPPRDGLNDAKLSAPAVIIAG